MFDSLYIIVFSFSIIALCLILSLFILLCLMKSQKTSIFYLIINLLILNNLHSFSYLFDWVKNGKLLIENNTLCQIQACVMIYTSISHEFWASSIPMINHIQNAKGEIYMKKHFKYYFTSFFVLYNIVPLIITLIFQKLDSLGQNNLYCWVKQPKGSLSKELIIQIIIFVLRWFNIVICTFYTIKIIIFLCSMNTNTKEEKQKQVHYSLQLLIFPLIQLIGEVIPVTYRTLLWIDNNYSIFWMQEAIVILGSFQSILYPICYCFHSGMFTYIHQSCSKNNEHRNTISLISQHFDDNDDNRNSIISLTYVSDHN